MELITASAIVSYTTKIEDDLAKFYDNLAKKYPEAKEVFLSFAKENRSNKTSVERTYYGIISDKLEACFVKTLNTDDYSINMELAENASYTDALKKALEVEEKTQRFLQDAAESTKALVPDVSWVLTRMGKKRGDRINKLKSLLEKAGR